MLRETDRLGRGIQLSVHSMLFIVPVSNTKMEGAVRKIKGLKKISAMLKCVGKHYSVGSISNKESLIGARLEKKEKVQNTLF